VESHEHTLLRDALEKLRLNDSSFNPSRTEARFGGHPTVLTEISREGEAKWL